jgi:hypothetical protein
MAVRFDYRKCTILLAGFSLQLSFWLFLPDIPRQNEILVFVLLVLAYGTIFLHASVASLPPRIATPLPFQPRPLTLPPCGSPGPTAMHPGTSPWPKYPPVTDDEDDGGSDDVGVLFHAARHCCKAGGFSVRLRRLGHWLMQRARLGNRCTPRLLHRSMSRDGRTATGMICERDRPRGVD